MTTPLPRSFRGRLLAWAALALVAVAGCSGGGGVKKVTVRGTVTYKGQPVQSAILKFVGPDFYSAAVVQSDGTFVVTDVIPGEVKVGIMESPQGSGSSSSPDDKKPAARVPAASLPEKYREPETSGLKYTITPETKDLHIDIK